MSSSFLTPIWFPDCLGIRSWLPLIMHARVERPRSDCLAVDRSRLVDILKVLVWIIKPTKFTKEPVDYLGTTRAHQLFKMNVVVNPDLEISLKVAFEKVSSTSEFRVELAKLLYIAIASRPEEVSSSQSAAAFDRLLFVSIPSSTTICINCKDPVFGVSKRTLPLLERLGPPRTLHRTPSRIYAKASSRRFDVYLLDCILKIRRPLLSQ